MTNTPTNTLPIYDNTSPVLQHSLFLPYPSTTPTMAGDLSKLAMPVPGSAISSRSQSQELLSIDKPPMVSSQVVSTDSEAEAEADDSGLGSVTTSPLSKASQPVVAHPSTSPVAKTSLTTAVASEQPVEPVQPQADTLYKYSEGVMPESVAKRLQAQARASYMQVQRGRRASRAKRRRRELQGVHSDDDVTDGAVSTQCPHCNKTYRQNNSLFKHLYEHHPHWEQISDMYNFTKHSKVQIMQTAEFLLSLKSPTRHGLQPLVRF
eukprot:TRINITY_DN11841_c0_g1_i1.p2 TRINITY_DN11841_c0_g1~~TRINITY_DN11841_c0_g1_i1.p2  ORF type:complete len:264 (+),score=58.99 TRINITY_DN11841_c0_g1_i1:492-1283(+)